MERKGRQRTLQINNVHLYAHLDRSRCCLKKRQKNFLTLGELTETNKALLFVSELGSNLNFGVFFSTVDTKADKNRYKKIKTIICHV